MKRNCQSCCRRAVLTLAGTNVCVRAHHTGAVTFEATVEGQKEHKDKSMGPYTLFTNETKRIPREKIGLEKGSYRRCSPRAKPCKKGLPLPGCRLESLYADYLSRFFTKIKTSMFSSWRILPIEGEEKKLPPDRSTNLFGCVPRFWLASSKRRGHPHHRSRKRTAAERESVVSATAIQPAQHRTTLRFDKRRRKH